MIIDIHTHVGNKNSKSVSVTLENLQETMFNNRVDYSVCFVTGENIHEESINLANHKDKSIIPFLRFDPKAVSPEELENLLPPFSGIKLHPRTENFDPLDEKFVKLFSVIEKSGKPVLIHTRKEDHPYSDPTRVLLLAKKYPQINFILGHFANDLQSVWSEAKGLPNVFFDTSIVSSPKIIEMAVKKYGSEKILFGSDYPYSDQEIELLKVLRAEISRQDKENILFRNALKVLKMGGE